MDSLTVADILLAWLFQLGPSAVLSLPFLIFSKRRSKWVWWEFSMFVLPNLAWFVLVAFNLKNKSVRNIGELFVAGILLAPLFVFHLIAGRNINKKASAFCVTLISVCIAAASYFLVPVDFGD